MFARGKNGCIPIHVSRETEKERVGTEHDGHGQSLTIPGKTGTATTELMDPARTQVTLGRAKGVSATEADERKPPMPNSIEITVPANPDLDDCLSGAADAYVAENPGLTGWDLSPRWTDETRESVTLTVPVL